MRKLKLQVQLSLDGFVAGPGGEMDLLMWTPDETITRLINELTDSSDTILLGRKMTNEFVSYWENVVDTQPDSPEFTFAQKMVGMQKIMFSKTRTSVAGRNITVENGDLVEAVNRLKKQEGKDIIVYGGANFVSSLIEADLIDDYYLFRTRLPSEKDCGSLPAGKHSNCCNLTCAPTA